MCFFRNILLIFIIVFFSLAMYQYFLGKKNNLFQKDYLILGFLCLMTGLLVIFNTDYLFLIFLDLPIFLAYFLKKRKYAIILSLVIVLYLSLSTQVLICYYIVYLFYFIINIVFDKYYNRLFGCLLFLKAFYSSLIFFLYFDHSIIMILNMIISIVYFHFIFMFVLKFIERNNPSSHSDENMLFQMAHEVKNPIAVCKGYLDMLDLTNQDKINKYIPIVRSEMNRSLTIMDDFLNLKRLSLHKDIMDLYMLLEDVRDTLQTVLRDKKVMLDFCDNEDELYIYGDYERLKQVFINIVKNAYEANATNINIWITVRSDEVIIDIFDNGDGISKKDMKRIGDMFFTTKVKGTGIGISLSKEIVRLHDGAIKYESVENEGTTVTVFLPLEKEIK